jgi:hypothetical protein
MPLAACKNQKRKSSLGKAASMQASKNIQIRSPQLKVMAELTTHMHLASYISIKMKQVATSKNQWN